MKITAFVLKHIKQLNKYKKIKSSFYSKMLKDEEEELTKAKLILNKINSISSSCRNKEGK
jgi:hypothetical protein